MSTVLTMRTALRLRMALTMRWMVLVLMVLLMLVKRIVRKRSENDGATSLLLVKELASHNHVKIVVSKSDNGCLYGLIYIYCYQICI